MNSRRPTYVAKNANRGGVGLRHGIFIQGRSNLNCPPPAGTYVYRKVSLPRFIIRPRESINGPEIDFDGCRLGRFIVEAARVGNNEQGVRGRFSQLRAKSGRKLSAEWPELISQRIVLHTYIYYDF